MIKGEYVNSETTLLYKLANTNNLLTIMLQLPKQRLINIAKNAYKARKIKYTRQQGTIYGDLPKSLTEDQLRTFFNKIYTKPLKRLFQIQFFYALRIGELNKLEILKEQGILRIWNEKCDRWDHLPIHGDTWKLFTTPLPEYTIDQARKVFNNTIRRCGLEYIYHTDRQGYKYRQFTPHSLRHTAITIFLDHIQNPIKAMKYSRHKKGRTYGSLETYITYRTEQLKKDLEKAFTPYYNIIQ